jgi:hypothetical protein
MGAIHGRFFSVIFQGHTMCRQVKLMFAAIIGYVLMIAGVIVTAAVTING